MPRTRPDTEWIGQECSACISYRKRCEIDWVAREKALCQILDEHHGECIVASSGGKDSTWITLKLLEFGAHVTCVTATTCQLTPIGRANIDNLARFARTIEVTPNRSVRKILNRLGLQLVGDISWPEHVSIFSTPFRVAQDMGVGLVFYGENPQEAYGGPLGTETAFELTPRWRSEFGGFLGLRPSDLIGKEGLSERDMQDYTWPDCRALVPVAAYFFGQFCEWDSHRNAEVAEANGFRFHLPTEANWWPFENQDNLQTGIHDWLMWKKYGYGRGCAQISVDVRAGLLSRSEALYWLQDHDGLFPDPYCGEPIEAVLDHIGMKHSELREIAERFSRSEEKER